MIGLDKMSVVTGGRYNWMTKNTRSSLGFWRQNGGTRVTLPPSFALAEWPRFEKIQP